MTIKTPINKANSTPNFSWWKKFTTADHISFLLVVVTFLLFIATVGLYCATRDLVIDAKDNSQRQLRAYVYIKPPPTGIQNVMAGKSPYAVVAIRNAGQTPAYNLKIRGNTGFGTYPLMPSQTFIEAPYGGSMVLNPETEISTGGVISQREDVSESDRLKNASLQADLDSIRDGKIRRLYLFGSITYTDAFGIERLSEYCFAYFGIGPILTDMNYCDRHNGQN